MIPEPRIEPSIHRFINNTLEELDLIGGVYPYEAQRRWPAWKAKAVHEVLPLWRDLHPSLQWPMGR